MARLNDVGFGASHQFVHVDSTLNAMVLPVLDDVPDGLRPTFRPGIDSLPPLDTR